MGGLSARVRSGHGRSRALATVICVLALASCRGSNTGYEGPFPAEVNAAIPRIERAMGVPFREPPRLETRTRAQVREFLEQRFAEDLPQEELVGVETTYKRLGLVADSLDLRSLYMSLLTEQIVGFYDPATKVLYVVEEAPEVQRSAIITHELIHALQDQYAPLDSIQESVRKDNDRALAVQAVIEGQAMYKQIEATVGGGSMAARLPGGWERVRQSIRDNRSTMPLFASAPMIMQETLIFPYLSGAEFVRRNDFASGPEVFERLPMSTEQIMHERAYGDSLDAPTRIVLPDPRAGEDVIYENGLGEFEMRVMLYVHLDDHGSAFRGAAGWDGDRFRVYRSGNSDALLWASVWDTEEDAEEFAEIATNAIARRYGERNLPAAERGSFVRSGRRVSIRRVELEGRPMVILEDVPASMRGELMALEGMRLEEG